MGERRMEVLGVSIKDGQYFMELADDEGCNCVPLTMQEAFSLMMAISSGRTFYATELEKEE